MRSDLAPGVYKAPRSSTDADLRLVRTDIAGFVGYAERGPLAPWNSPTLPEPAELAIRLTNWDEYRARFGGLTSHAYMPYAVRAFFENGGKICYVSRVAASSSDSPNETPKTASFALAAGDVAVRAAIVARAAGRGASALVLGATASLAAGMVVGFEIPTGQQLATIATVTDAQNLTLSSPLSDDVAAGATAWVVAATGIPKGALAGQTDVHVANSRLFTAGDIVALTRAGMIETAEIAGVPDATTVRLKSKLRGDFDTTAFMRRQSSGFSIEAISAGNWGNRLSIDLTPRLPAPPKTRWDRFDLKVTLAPGPDVSAPREGEKFLDLSLDSAERRYAPTIINDQVSGSRLIRIAISDTFGEFTMRDGRVAPFPIGLTGGRDGLAAVTVRDFIGGDGDFRGLRVLEEIEEIGILVVPDAVNAGQTAPTKPTRPEPDRCAPPPPEPPPDPVADDPTAPPRWLDGDGDRGTRAVFQAMIDQARRLHYRVAILDTPDGLEPAAVAAWLTEQTLPPAFAPFAAVYYPWLLAPDGLKNEVAIRRVPPGGHVAGVYAQVDNRAGVQHPPANVELQFAVGAGKLVSAIQQGKLNECGINVIRSFPGRGIRLWGARSLAASPEYGSRPQWAFIHVRRTMSMIEDSVEKSMQWTVFESNDPNLRRTLTHSLNVFLERIWRGGGLKGATIREAFYVKCDDTNNPQAAIDLGLLVCEVGVAIAAPMEFLTFQVRRRPDGSNVVEA